MNDIIIEKLSFTSAHDGHTIRYPDPNIKLNDTMDIKNFITICSKENHSWFLDIYFPTMYTGCPKKERFCLSWRSYRSESLLVESFMYINLVLSIQTTDLNLQIFSLQAQRLQRLHCKRNIAVHLHKVLLKVRQNSIHPSQFLKLYSHFQFWQYQYL